MADLDKMACEILDSRPDAAFGTAADFTGHAYVVLESEARCAIRTALQTAPPGYVLVPVELIDAFPEINPSNYDHDDACRLNAWGCQVVTTAAPEVK